MNQTREKKLTPQETVKKFQQKRLCLNFERRQMNKARAAGNIRAAAEAEKRAHQLQAEVDQLNAQIEEYRRAATLLYRHRGKAIAQNFMII